MAAGGGLPDLPAQLRRLRRRRPRRPAGGSCPGSRTWPRWASTRFWLSPFYPSALADGGYDVDDYRDVDPRLGTLADFDEMTARLHAMRDQGHRRHRAESHLEPARLVHRGPGRPEGIAGQGPVHLPRRAGPGRGAAPLGLALHVRRLGLDPCPGRAVVPAPVRRRAARPQLGEPRGPGRFPDHAAVLVRPRGRRVPGGCGARPGQGPVRAARAAARRAESGRPARPARDPSALGPGRGPRPSTPNGGRSSTSTTRRGPAWPRRGCTRPGGRGTPARTGWARPSTSTCSKRTGTAAEFLRVITDNLADAQQHGASTTWVLSNHDVVRHASRYALPAEDHLSSTGTPGHGCSATAPHPSSIAASACGALARPPC